jgi:CENP-B N-terminal DNA-binding domain
MNTHRNAPLTPKGREAMVRRVEAGLSKAAAARQFNTTAKTVATRRQVPAWDQGQEPVASGVRRRAGSVLGARPDRHRGRSFFAE